MFDYDGVASLHNCGHAFALAVAHLGAMLSRVMSEFEVDSQKPVKVELLPWPESQEPVPEVPSQFKEIEEVHVVLNSTNIKKCS